MCYAEVLAYTLPSATPPPPPLFLSSFDFPNGAGSIAHLLHEGCLRTMCSASVDRPIRTRSIDSENWNVLF